MNQVKKLVAFALLILANSVRAASKNVKLNKTKIMAMIMVSILVSTTIIGIKTNSVLAEIIISGGITPYGEYETETFESSTGILSLGVNGVLVTEPITNKSEVKELIIEEGVTGIDCTFANYPNLETVIIADSVRNINSNAFQGCSELKKVVLSKNLNGISGGTFRGCTSLTEIEIPSSVRKIGDYAFSDCTSLTNITIPDSVKEIGAGSFNGCTVLKSVLLSSNIKELSESVFSNCSSLKEINIPENIKKIGTWAFNGCSDLTEISIGSNVEELGAKAFEGTKYYSDNYKDNELYLDKYLLEVDRFLTGEYKIKDGTKVIADEALKNCKISGVTIPDSVKNIGRYAFDSNDNLTSIIIPSGVESIGYSAFSDCRYLQNIIIQDGVKNIDDFAFYGCQSLAEIQLPNSVTYVGDSAFSYCTKLDKIDLGSSIEYVGEECFEQTKYYDNVENWEEGNLYISNCLIKVDSNISELTIKDGTRCVASGACHSWEEDSDLENIVLPEGLLSIGKFAFSYTKLSSIAFPDSIKIIGDYAFSGCSNIREIYLGDNTEYVGWEAFNECSNLEKVSISGNVSALERTFARCINLKSIILPKSLKIIGDDTFYGCSSLEEIEAPNGIESIGTNAFIECENLKKVTLPASIDYIGVYIMESQAIVYYNGTKEQLDNIIFEDILDNELYCEGVKYVYLSRCVEDFDEEEGTTTSKENEPITSKENDTTTKKVENNTKPIIEATTHKAEDVKLPTASKIKNIKKAKKSLKITWKKVKKVSGYQIQYSTSSKFKKAKNIIIKKAKTTTKTIKKLKAKQKYYVRIRTYITVNGKKYYSKWSKKSQKTK